MSHEISIIDTADGRKLAEAAYRNDPAWHGLGQTMAEDSDTSEEAMKAANLGWHVSKRAIQTVDGIEIPGSFATVRDDLSRPLGIVGERYTVLQNAEAFAFLDGLVQDRDMRYESAMALQGGARIVLLARFPEVDTIIEGDRLLRYLLLTTAHDGSGAVDILPTDVRVVCANTLRLARSQGNSAPYRATIKHTPNMRAALAEAQEFIRGADARFAAFADDARTLADRKASEAQARDFIATLYPAPEIVAESAPAETVFGVTLPPKQVSNKAQTQYLNRIQQVRDAYMHPSNQLPAMRGTWWQLLNAVTYTVDHNARVRGRNDQQRAENRFLSTVDGQGADFKARALALALDMSA